VAHSRIVSTSGRYSLIFTCGDLPTDDAVIASGHEPNGYFWEGIATLVAPDLVDGLAMDCEADMFSASGRRDDIESLRQLLEPVLSDAKRVRALIAQAESEGFEFDD
jgi:esterase/lipase superfamily enzyme